MKAFLTLILLTIWFSSESQSHFGGRIGINLAKLENMDQEKISNTERYGFYGGLIYNYQLNPELLLQSEINFSSEGGKKHQIEKLPAGMLSIPGTNNIQDVYANLNTKTNIHYLEVPVLAKFILGNKVKYFMSMGPYVSFLLDAQQRATGNSVIYLDRAATQTLKVNNPLQTEEVNSYFDYKIKFNDHLKKVNYGFIGGCGLQFPSGPGDFFMEYRLKLGMSNIYKFPEVDGRNQTTSVAVSVGYTVKIKQPCQRVKSKEK